jgi:hypothetical protein
MQLPPGLFEAQLGNEASDEGPDSVATESDEE